jgi:hypothetical protein
MFGYNVQASSPAGSQVYRVYAKSAVEAAKQAKKLARKGLPFGGYFGWLQTEVVGSGHNAWSAHKPVVAAPRAPYSVSFAGLVSVT